MKLQSLRALALGLAVVSPLTLAQDFKVAISGAPTSLAPRFYAAILEYLMSGQYWISFFPGLSLLFIVVTINVVGSQLGDVINPRLQTQ
ncbi:hypothetical protein [Massilia glaciei]|uniref:ABC transporter permease n=1 Tax=Massilia glaciei TaxID=1524097 RepID=A0A2U2HHM9_9BURK|nr:hypothetical protein C7C56_017880 [Massilia glaciei]